MPNPEPLNTGLANEPYWYKSGVIYEVHIRAFFDSNGDGAGDLRGLTEKLDYLKDLGVTAIWLLPFFPSPLKDDGYDISDYCDVHPMYGTLGDFKTFMRQAHQRGLRVIIELVLNHTSDQHPWFQRARRAEPGSRWRNFYVWNDSPDKYKDAPIVFNGVEVSNWTLDPVAGAYFWHRFFSHQPDLNFENPEVRDEIFKVVDFWFDLGVDGLRLDAVPYLYERDGTTCENLPETHAFLKSLRAHVEGKYSDRMLLAEANLWPEDAVSYFGEGRGDECHMAFHFPLMPRLFMALRMEDRLPITDILEQTPPIPETCQWALFLRNHDELTLATVTDEERDYMYRMYAQARQARLYLGIRRRLAPLLGNDRKSIELLNALLFSLPGTPVLYYGDEIGLGDNIFLGDRNGVRTPMQWSSDKNAGFSRANPQGLYLPIILDPAYHYEACNVEEQLASPHSLLWWMRRLLALRKRWRALGEGKCEFLQPDNNKILSYVLRYEQETILVVANLSRFAQPVELDLSAYKQMTPIELFGRTKYPVISEAPYFLTLGPHNFFWFSLELKSQAIAAKPGAGVPVSLPSIKVAEDWREIFTGGARAKFEAVLPEYLKSLRGFTDEIKNIKHVTTLESFNVPWPDENATALAFFQVEFVDANAEICLLPLAFAADGSISDRLRQNGIAALTLRDGTPLGLVCDAFVNPSFSAAMWKLIAAGGSLQFEQGELKATAGPAPQQSPDEIATPAPPINNAIDGNATVLLGDKVMLMFFRQLRPGVNPELEISRYLTEKNFPYSPPLLGALEYARADEMPVTLAVAKSFVPHSVNARDFMLEGLSRYYDRVFADAAQGHDPPAGREAIEDYVGTSIESARHLGTRTAQLHLALASGDSAEFSKLPLTSQYRRSVFQSMRALAIQNLRLLRRRARSLPPDLAPVVQEVGESESALIDHYRRLVTLPIDAARIRIHGDLHLGRMLWTGREFIFLDFQGDPTVPFSERRIKMSPLRDVARMLRSFHHTAYAGFHQQAERGVIAAENLPNFEHWVRHWNQAVSWVYLEAYRKAMDKSGIIPANDEQWYALLQAYLLNQCIKELGESLQLPPDNVRAPLRAIAYLTKESMAARAPRMAKAE